MVTKRVIYFGLCHKPTLFIGEFRQVIHSNFKCLFNAREFALEMSVLKMINRENHTCNDENTNVNYEECLSTFMSNQLNCTLFWTNQTGMYKY